MKATLLATALIVCACPAFAQRVSKMSGAGLQTACTGRGTEACEAYLAGIADTLGELGPKRGGIACIPPVVTGAQLRIVVQKYLRDHPEKLQLRAAKLALEAYQTSFPCSP